jgi:uncharacterized protein
VTAQKEAAVTARPAPSPVHWDRPFWQAAARGVLIAQRCQECGHRQHYPRPACTRCLSQDLGWDELSGRGAVYSHTVVRQPVHASFREEAPYVLADVTLDEGIRLIARVLGAGPGDVHIGARVIVVFEPSGQVHLPCFRLHPGHSTTVPAATSVSISAAE